MPEQSSIGPEPSQHGSGVLVAQCSQQETSVSSKGEQVNIKQKAAGVWATRLGKAAVIGVAAVLLVGGGSAVAAVTGVTYPLARNSVASGQVVDGSIIENDLNPAVKTKLNKVGTGEQGPKGDTGAVGPAGPAGAVGPKGDAGATGATGAKGDKGDAGDPATDVKGTGISKSFDPVTIAHIGGSFKTQKTKIGEFTLPAGTWMINSSAFFARSVAGVDGTRPQLALRVGASDTAFGVDYGTILGAEISPAKDRELTGSAVKVVTVNAATTVEVFSFGYNDDAGSAGSGEITAAADVAAVRVG